MCDCVAVDFPQLLHTAALQTLHVKIMVYDMHYKGLGETQPSQHVTC